MSQIIRNQPWDSHMATQFDSIFHDKFDGLGFSLAATLVSSGSVLASDGVRKISRGSGALIDPDAYWNVLDTDEPAYQGSAGQQVLYHPTQKKLYAIIAYRLYEWSHEHDIWEAVKPNGSDTVEFVGHMVVFGYDLVIFSRSLQPGHRAWGGCQERGSDRSRWGGPISNCPISSEVVGYNPDQGFYTDYGWPGDEPDQAIVFSDDLYVWRGQSLWRYNGTDWTDLLFIEEPVDEDDDGARRIQSGGPMGVWGNNLVIGYYAYCGGSQAKIRTLGDESGTTKSWGTVIAYNGSDVVSLADVGTMYGYIQDFVDHHGTLYMVGPTGSSLGLRFAKYLGGKAWTPIGDVKGYPSFGVVIDDLIYIGGIYMDEAGGIELDRPLVSFDPSANDWEQVGDARNNGGGEFTSLVKYDPFQDPDEE